MKFLFVLLFPAYVLSHHINIFAPPGKFGLANDIKILTEELSRLGHTVSVNQRKNADINIHVQKAFYKSFQYAPKNYLMPNPDWFIGDIEKVVQFDLILCKTWEAVRIFEPHNPHTQFTSFTSRDHFEADVEKNFKGLFHCASTCILKGTSQILETWSNNPDLPVLTLLNSKKIHCLPMHNLETINQFLPVEMLKKTQNQHGIHLCLSQTEGFGHNIFEALSCGVVVMTTDAPPMNEIVTDPRCLVPYNNISTFRLADRYFFDSKILTQKIEALLLLPDEELKEIGRKNRKRYLKNDRFFKKRLEEVFGNA